MKNCEICGNPLCMIQREFEAHPYCTEKRGNAGK